MRQRLGDLLQHARRHLAGHGGAHVGARMHEIGRPWTVLGDRFGEIREARLLHEGESVLHVPPGDLVVLPDPVPQAIQRHETLGAEERDPIARPLFVHVVGAALTGHGRGEENDIAKTAEVGDEALAARGGQVLGDFQAVDEIEPTVETQRHGEVRSAESVGWEEQLLRPHDVAVDPQHVAAGVGIGLGPCAGTAADIDDRPAREQAQDERHRLAGRGGGILLQTFVVPGRIGRRHVARMASGDGRDNAEVGPPRLRSRYRDLRRLGNRKNPPQHRPLKPSHELMPAEVTERKLRGLIAGVRIFL